MSEEVKLIPAKAEDAERIHQLKREAFLPLYEKYRDDATSPAKEKLDKVILQLQDEKTAYYFISVGEQQIGAVRVVERESAVFSISPIFILPQYQDKGIGSIVINKLFQSYKSAVAWKLSTILQEERNCHFYEKLGFRKTGEKTEVQENMTIIGYEKTNVTVRPYRDSDAETIVNLIIRNFREVNSRDYGKEEIEELVRTHDAEWFRGVAGYAHVYVLCLDEKIVGVGSISSYWGSPDESILLTIFVLPEYHGKGIGRQIIRTVEADELFVRAKRIEIPASITAVEFYRKFGYDFKGGERKLDEEGHYRLEKFKKAGERAE